MNIDRKQTGIARMFNVSGSLRRITGAFVLLLTVAQFALAQTADPGNAKFDHVQTGFNLTGSHAQTPCTSCHIQGVFKGTPRDCASCHVTGNRMGATAKPATHIPTFAKCDNCHKTTVWTDATFSHVGLAPGSCLTCHNGTTATGKSSGHVPATGSCDICHTTTISWQQAVFSHTGIVSGCASCHSGQSFNGVTPVSKPMNHIDTQGSPCEACHTSTTTFTSAAGTPMPANHLPTTQSCGICHNMAGFNPGVMNHLGILGGCASCHNGQSFYGVTPVSKPSNHLPTSAACETCHSANNFSTFSGTSMIHTGIVSGCSSCHNGQTFAGVTPVSKPVNHLPTSSACETCHSASQFTSFSGTSMNHSGILNGCASCHNGQVFAGVTPVSKSAFASHQVTSADCSTCHFSTVTFVTGTTTEPANHLPTTQSCATCHSSFGVNSGVMNHLGIVSGCASCHNGQAFYGVTPVSKPSNHLPTSSSCETCHSTSQFTSFSGTSMNHTGILSGCANCHNGQVFAGVTPVSKASYPSHQVTTADCSTCHTSTVTFVTSSGGTMPSNHLPTTQVCSTCHTSYGTNSGVMNHLGILSGCATCHGGQSFYGVTPVSKPSNHLPTTAACETCHSASKFTSFSGTSMVHTGILNGCASCHNGQVFAGVTPVSKPTNHLPTTSACETCHSASQFTSFSGTSMNHSGIVNNCTNCHNGQVFAGVTPVSKPSNHIPYASSLTGGASMACEFCHSPTVYTSFTSLASSTTMHNGTLGNGSGWCKTCHVSGTSYLGVTGDKKSVTHQSSTGTDCSQSGCHRPLGSKGSSYTSWD